MKPAEVALSFEQFQQTVQDLKGDNLLDRWISFRTSSERKETDLGMLKSVCLEALLIQQFGLDWHYAVEERQTCKSDA